MRQTDFYYPTNGDMTILMTMDELTISDEISCSDLFGRTDLRERILIVETVGDERKQAEGCRKQKRGGL